MAASSGVTYKFRIEARNGVGYSAYSSDFSILAATNPEPPAEPTTTRVAANIVVDWEIPTDLNGASILGYKIYVLEKDGVTWSQALSNCDGTTPNALVYTECTIPISTLIS